MLLQLLSRSVPWDWKINFLPGVDMEMPVENMIFLCCSKWGGHLVSEAVNLADPSHGSWVSPRTTAYGPQEASPTTSYTCPLHHFTGRPSSVDVELETHCLLRFTPCYPCSIPNSLPIRILSTITNTASFLYIWNMICFYRVDCPNK